jgi:hypothetical protein
LGGAQLAERRNGQIRVYSRQRCGSGETVFSVFLALNHENAAMVSGILRLAKVPELKVKA